MSLSASGRFFPLLQVMSYALSLKTCHFRFLLIPTFSGSDFTIEYLIGTVAMTTPNHKI